MFFARIYTKNLKLILMLQNFIVLANYFLIIKNISKIPTIPNTGYSKSTNTEKLICDKKIAKKLTIPNIVLYVFLDFVQLLKKL